MLWENPHQSSTPMDCCPCVFSLLGMPPETVRYLRENNLKGFSEKQIESGFNTGYPDFIFKFQKSSDLTANGPDITIDIIKYMGNNTTKFCHCWWI